MLELQAAMKRRRRTSSRAIVDIVPMESGSGDEKKIHG